MQHDLSAQFDVRRTGSTLSNVVLKSGQSQVLLNASLDNYSKSHRSCPVHDDAGHGGVSPGPEESVAAQRGSPGERHGRLHFRSRPPTARHHFGGRNDQEFSTAASYANVCAPTFAISARAIASPTAMRNCETFEARLLGGQFSGTATVRDLAGKQQGHVVAALRNISLADLKRVANSVSLRPVAISGQVNATADANWTGSMNNLVVRADATAKANVAPAQSDTDNGSLPVNAVIHARYAERNPGDCAEPELHPYAADLDRSQRHGEQSVGAASSRAVE